MRENWNCAFANFQTAHIELRAKKNSTENDIQIFNVLHTTIWISEVTYRLAANGSIFSLSSIAKSINPARVLYYNERIKLVLRTTTWRSRISIHNADTNNRLTDGSQTERVAVIRDVKDSSVHAKIYIMQQML